MSCTNCNKEFQLINKKYYNYEIYLLKNICIKNNIEFILCEIQKYLFDLNESHLINYEEKKRNPNFINPIYHDDEYDYEDNYDEIYEPYIYTNKSINICKKCMIIGINKYYHTTNRLPHMRNDIYTFLWYKLFNDMNFEKYYEKEKFILPQKYYCSYYRSKKPIEINNKLKILER